MEEEKANSKEVVEQKEAEEPKEINRTGEATKEHKTKKFAFPFHFWKKKKAPEAEEKQSEVTEMKEQTGAESEAPKQESGAGETAKTDSEPTPMEEVKQQKESSSSSSSSSHEQENQQKEDEKKTYAEAVTAKQSAPTEEQPKMDIPKPEPETKKKAASKGIFSIFHRKPSKEKEPETAKASTESSQENETAVNQPEMTENAIADKMEEKPKEISQENNAEKEEPRPEIKTAGVEGPEDGSESNRKAEEPKMTEETEFKQAEDSEAKEIPKEVSEKQSGGFFHKFLRAFGCGGEISKDNTQPTQQAATA